MGRINETERKNIEWYRSLPVMRFANITEFERMPEYSATQPTGVAIGKMWRRFHGSWNDEWMKRGGIPKWVVCRYEAAPDEYCMTNYLLTNRGEVKPISALSVEENAKSRRLFARSMMAKTVMYRPVICVRIRRRDIAIAA